MSAKLSKFLKSKLITGTLVLTVTGIITRCIGFFYKIFLSRQIGAEALGIYQLVFPLFMFSLAICCGGIQTAISRSVAFCGREAAPLGQNKSTSPQRAKKEALLYLYIGMSASVLLSVLCSIFIYGKAGWFSLHLLQEASCEPLLQVMVLAIPFACIHACINAYYYGIKRTAVPAISQLLEQITRVVGVSIIFFLMLESGQSPSAGAAIWGIVIGEFSSASFSWVALRIHSKKEKYRDCSAINHTAKKPFSSLLPVTKKLGELALPLTCNRFLLSIAQGLENILIPASLRLFGYSGSDALALYGILTGMALASIMVPAVLSNSLSVMLLPEIAKAQANGQEARIRILIRKTVAFSLILGFVCTFLFVSCGPFAGTYLFHNHLAGVYIQILAWICPFLFLGSTLCSILNGLGRPKAVLCTNLTASLLRIGFVVLAIPAFGVKGYLWGALISQMMAAGLAYLLLKRSMFARA